MNAGIGLIALLALLAPSAHAQPARVAKPAPLIAVANFNSLPPNSGTLATFGFDAMGNVAPATLLEGGATGIVNPSDVAIDAAGEVVALYETSPFGFNPAISVFAAGASGDVAPSRVITDPFKKRRLFDVGVDAAGYIYGLFMQGNTRFGIDVFPPGSNGVTRPVRTIAGPATLLQQPLTIVQFYVGAAGDVWWACDGEVGPPIVVEYAPGANGNVTPLATLPLTANNTPSFAVNASGALYVSQTVASRWVTQVYPAIQQSSTPSRTYTTDCGGNCTVAAARGTVAVFRTTQGVSPSALVFYDLSGPSRELHSIRTISGPKTQLDNPLGAAIQ